MLLLLRITGLCNEASYADTRMGAGKEVGQRSRSVAGEEKNSEKPKRERDENWLWEQVD